MRQKGKLFLCTWSVSPTAYHTSSTGHNQDRLITDMDEQRRVIVLVTALAGSDPSVETGNTSTVVAAFEKDLIPTAKGKLFYKPN